MYCSLVMTVVFSVLSLLLFRTTFEMCQHSLATALSRRVYGSLSGLYYKGLYGFLLSVFYYFGKLVSKLFFHRKLPNAFYVHCHPLVGSLMKESMVPPLSGSVVVFKRGFVWLLNAVSLFLKRPLNHSHVYSFFGLLVFVRLLFLVALLLSLYVVVKYFLNLLKLRSVWYWAAVVLAPSLLLANLVNFLASRALFSFWYLTGLFPLVAALYWSHTRFLLTKKQSRA